MTAKIKLASALLGIALVAAAPSSAQDGMPQLPEICTANAGQAMAPMESGHEMAPADAAHADLQMGMDEINTTMMKSMTATDIDVAFVCSMIPHHQGAINMAKAELEHGDDQWARDLAQKVIEAQEREIADMLAWLERQAE